MPLSFLLRCICLLLLPRQSVGQVVGNSVTFPRPRITEVSAMCTQEGITAMVMFEGEFMGKIYSERYGTVHDCIYYNGYDMNMILFSVPNFKCGTRVSKSQNQNIIQRIENEVYIQWDKDMQNADDRRYLFICESTSTSPFNPINPIFPTPGPVFPRPTTNNNPNSIIPDFSGTIRPDQTIIIQTGRPTEIIGQGTIGATDPNIYMEIQDGYGPDRPPVNRIVELGESVTLVIGGRIPQSNPRFDMRVHSCYATDGSGNTRIEIIDKNGCSSRESIAENMKKARRANLILLYTPIKAFKFPSSEDVYFTCSVDACSACDFPDPCSSNRGKRDVAPDNEDLDGMEVVQSMVIRRPRSALDGGPQRVPASEEYSLCLSKDAVAALVTLVTLTMAAFVAMGFLVVRTRTGKGKKSESVFVPPVKPGLSRYF